MIKLIVFDLDGVLVDCKEIHYEALNLALDFYKFPKISREEHLTKYDGLTTNQKLKLLNITDKLAYSIWKKKQELSNTNINKINRDERLISLFKLLKEDGYLLYVASNSIRKTVELFLQKLGLLEYVDLYVSNDDVINPKPHSEIYLRCMIEAGVNPKETLILEDSNHGRKSAIDSGAVLCAIDCTEDVTYEKIKSDMKRQVVNKNKFVSDKINVLIPMAGLGSRFEEAGYTFPKPLIEINNKPMIQLVIDNLNIEANFIYVVQKKHYDKYNLKYLLNVLAPNCKIIPIEEVTSGSAISTLLAKEYINNDNPLIISNSDQFLEWKSEKFYYSILNDKNDGTIVTFTATHPKWSFVKLDDNGFVIEVAEKKPISDIATVGIYHYSKGSDYVKYAEQMIAKEKRVNNEFYIAPVYNEFIEDNKKIKTFHIDKMHGLGDPESLENFINNYEF